MLDPRLFTLVSTEDDSLIYAVGIDLGDEAVTYRRDPVTGNTVFHLHASAEGAHRVLNRVTPLTLCWDDEWLHDYLDLLEESHNQTIE